MQAARTRISTLLVSTAMAIAAIAAIAATFATSQVPVSFVPVGVRYEPNTDPAEHQRDLEEMRRLRFNVVAARGAVETDAPLGVIDRLLGGAADAHIRGTGVGTVFIGARMSAPAVALRAWRQIAAGAAGILFDDWAALQQNSDALVAAAAFAEHITRNSALYAPLRPRAPAPGSRDVTLTGGDGSVTASLLESPDALLLIVTNSDPAQAREVTMTFSPEMPEAVWQNMLSGASVNFVAGPSGPVYTRALPPEGVLVLMIQKRWK